MRQRTERPISSRLENEWYKAAYYSVSGDSYSLYANGSGTVPTKGGGETGWNYDFVNSDPNLTRDIADGSSEQNSTVNMMGNVGEWMENSAGVVRGGYYIFTTEYNLRSSYRFGVAPSNGRESVGFRPVEVIPEPATAGLLGISAIVFYAIRRIKNFNRLV